MSYKLNLKNPERKNRLAFKREKIRLAVASPRNRTRHVSRKGMPAYFSGPKPENKYILSGPACNVKSPADIFYPNGEKWNYYD